MSSKMNIILLSGGSGKRLWPLSNDIRSKQFIKIFKTDNGYESMVQRVYRQIKAVDSDATVTIATSRTQVSAIHNQLGENVGVSVEPCRRDTFPAIALATAYLHEGVCYYDQNDFPQAEKCLMESLRINQDMLEAVKRGDKISSWFQEWVHSADSPENQRKNLLQNNFYAKKYPQSRVFFYLCQIGETIDSANSGTDNFVTFSISFFIKSAKWFATVSSHSNMISS